MPVFAADLLPDTSGRNLGNSYQQWVANLQTVNVWSGSLQVYSPDQTRNCQISVANGYDPGIGSSTGFLRITNGNQLILQNDAPLKVYSKNGSRYFSVGTGDTTDPMLFSSTGRLVTASSIATSIAFACHAGASAGSTWGNGFNINWTSGNVEVWIDSTKVGNISFVSDYRLKRNVESFTGNALALIHRLRVVAFNYINPHNDLDYDDGKRHVGFLAHEVGEVVPSACDGDKDARTVDGKIQPQSIRQLDLIAVLIKAVQELSAKVKALEEPAQA